MNTRETANQRCREQKPDGFSSYQTHQLSNQEMLIQLQHGHGRIFTDEEDLLLRQLVTNYGEQNWEKIASHFPGRNGRQCRDRWKNVLSPQAQMQQWTEEENEVLWELVECYGERWDRIVPFFPGWTESGLRNRWNLKKRKVRKIADAGFSRKKPAPRVPTMYGMVNGGKQGPHTIPAVLVNSFINQRSYDEVSATVPSPLQFLQMCDLEEIILEDNEVYQYLELTEQMAEAGNAGNAENDTEHDTSELTFPGNIASMGWKEPAKRLLNMSPYGTYHYQSPIDLRSEKGRAMMKGKGTERVAANELDQNGHVSMETALKSLDGTDSAMNQFQNQEAARAYFKRLLLPMVGEENWDEAKFAARFK